MRFIIALTVFVAAVNGASSSRVLPSGVPRYVLKLGPHLLKFIIFGLFKASFL